MFSLTFKAFVMSVTFLLFRCNFYIVLAREKVTKKAFIEVFSRQKKPETKNPQTPSYILCVFLWVDRPSAQLIFPNASKTSSSQNFLLILCEVILVPQKMLNKTSNLKMAVCKGASRGCNQNPSRTPVNYLIFVKL